VPVDTPQVDELSKLKEDIKAGVNTENRSITFSDIHFTKGKADLLPQSDSALAEALGLMRDVPELKVEIIGHTSEEGSESFNRKLSQKRAEAVMKYLENQGIDALRMKATGKGFDEPLAPNDTEENRSKNRRTEFKVTDDGVKDS
jgi:outer membrane protein OmpA-like peptidoglycan-associated protein